MRLVLGMCETCVGHVWDLCWACVGGHCEPGVGLVLGMGGTCVGHVRDLCWACVTKSRCVSMTTCVMHD